MKTKFALPKGRLLPGVQQALSRAGLKFSQPDDRCYALECGHLNLELKLFKPRAIPQLVALDICQIGFVGQDLIEEAGYERVVPLIDLKLNPVEIVVATHASTPDILTDPPPRPLVIATEYVNLADRWAHRRGLAHVTVQTWGSTEGYAPDEADIVFDCRETGATIKANGLVVIDRIMKSSTWLACHHDRWHSLVSDPEIRGLLCRLEETTC